VGPADVRVTNCRRQGGSIGRKAPRALCEQFWCGRDAAKRPGSPRDSDARLLRGSDCDGRGGPCSTEGGKSERARNRQHAHGAGPQQPRWDFRRGASQSGSGYRTARHRPCRGA